MLSAFGRFNERGGGGGGGGGGAVCVRPVQRAGGGAVRVRFTLSLPCVAGHYLIIFILKVQVGGVNTPPPPPPPPVPPPLYYM